MTTNKKKLGPKSKAKNKVETGSIEDMDSPVSPAIEEPVAPGMEIPANIEPIGEPEWIYTEALAEEDSDAAPGNDQDSEDDTNEEAFGLEADFDPSFAAPISSADSEDACSIESPPFHCRDH